MQAGSKVCWKIPVHLNEFQVKMPETRYQRIRTGLLAWFESNQRKLPWRLRYLPYEIWISEIMLQQTQVQTMLPYYNRWMERFPRLQAVALAPEEQLLKCWEGMGYYARVKNIRKTANLLVEKFDAAFPKNYDVLLGLPGIGRYTAGAIMSIAFNADYTAVDGNVARIFARLFDVESPLQDKESQKACWTIAECLLPKGKARSFNQALMDFGAMVCTPRNPSCTECPIRALCRGLQVGVVNQRPVSRRARDIVPIHAALGVLVREGKIFIQKRPPSGLMPDLWEFPGGKLQDGETPEDALVREFQEELELRVRDLRKIAQIRHSYTTFRVTLHAFTCHLEDASQEPLVRSAVDGRWVTPRELDLYAFPAANRSLIKLIQTKHLSPWDSET
jgi:A/G-specific adenine glycosylase